MMTRKNTVRRKGTGIILLQLVFTRKWMLLFFGLTGTIFCRGQSYEWVNRQKWYTPTDTSQVIALIRKGAAFLDEHKLDSSLNYFNQVLYLSEKLDYPLGKAKALCNLGIIYYRSTQYEKAMEYYQRGLHIAEQHNLYLLQGLSIQNIGELNYLMGNTRLGLALFSRAEQILQKQNAEAELATLYLIKADCLNITASYDSSSQCLDKAVTLCTQRLSLPTITPALRNRFKLLMLQAQYIQANIFVARKKEAQAGQLYYQVLNDSLRFNGEKLRQMCYLRLADLSMEKNQYANARRTIDTLFALLRTDSFPDVYAVAYEQRGRLNEAENRHNEALYDYKRYTAISDSMAGIEVAAKIYLMQQEYEMEKEASRLQFALKQKKAFQIASGITAVAALFALLLVLLFYRKRKLQKKLYTRDLQITQQEREIEKHRLQQQLAELEQAALLARMNPHFIFNSLQAVQQFVINSDLPGANRYISMLGNLIRTTLNNAAKPAIRLSEELQYLETYLALEQMRMRNSFHYAFTLNPEIDAECEYIPPMLLQPLLENALKHGIRHLTDRTGFIHMEIEPLPGGLCYTLTDNGVGRAAAAQYNGRITGNHQSKGIMLCMERVSLIRSSRCAASLHIHDLFNASGEPAGTKVLLQLPAQPEDFSLA